MGKEEMFIKNYAHDGIYCNVPLGAWQTHPGLYFPPFSIFDSKEVPKEGFLKIAGIAAEFVASMTKHYQSERERSQAIITYISDVFPSLHLFSHGTADYYTDISFQTKVRSRSFQTKVRSRGSPKVFLIGNIEVKNGLGLTGTDPNLQNVYYYKNMLKVNNVPGINPFVLISIVGRDYLQAFGAVLTETGNISCAPIIQPLSLLFELRITTTIEKMAEFLYKLNWLLGEIEHYYKSGVDNKFPMFFSDRFTDIKQINPAIYQCSLKQGDTQVLAIVKFTRRYGTEVHRYMAEEGLAPDLFEVEVLEGGWLAVVMKFINNGRRISTSDAAEIHRCKEFLQSIVLPKLQEKSYVHGDLRLANIMFDGNGKLLIIDYDWAGTTETVHFPLDLNTELNWPESVIPGGFITIHTDEEIVNNLEDLI